jgi:hypothetical protein
MAAPRLYTYKHTTQRAGTSYARPAAAVLSSASRIASRFHARCGGGLQRMVGRTESRAWQAEFGRRAVSQRCIPVSEMLSQHTDRRYRSTQASSDEDLQPPRPNTQIKCKSPSAKRTTHPRMAPLSRTVSTAYPSLAPQQRISSHPTSSKRLPHLPDLHPSPTAPPTHNANDEARRGHHPA